MPDTEHMIFIMEMIGTVAFAVSGGMVAIRKNLDLLGILVLGVTTACGGGLIRDLVIGIQPPIMFLKSVYVTAAVISDLLLFAIVKCFRSSMEFLSSKFYERTLNLMDAIGLGVFTVVGVNAAIRLKLDSYVFLKIFLGVITGVGGGTMGVVPGVMGVAAFAPPLDDAGNSVKAQAALSDIVGRLNLNIFHPRKSILAEQA